MSAGNDYELEIDPRLTNKNELDQDDLEEYINSLQISIDDKDAQLRDYQFDAVYLALTEKNLSLESSTSSGKTLITYCICRALLDNYNLKKILIVVPRLQLVTQLLDNFEDYAAQTDWFANDHVHLIYQDQDDNKDVPIYCSTWQSIYKKPQSYFDQFQAIVVDECHSLKANALKGILEKAPNCEYRIGMTGTFDDIKANQWVIEGLTGPKQVISTTKELMDAGEISKIKIIIPQLRYSKNEVTYFKKVYGKSSTGVKRPPTYQDEIAYLINHPKRNEFIVKLATNQTNNTIVLFNKKLHGEELLRIANENYGSSGKEFYLIHGNVSLTTRDLIKKRMEQKNNIVAFVSYGTFSTGISINNIHVGIFASPSKGKIRVLQSIGRGLRLHSEKENFTLYDIVDDMSMGKSKKNYALSHFVNRFGYYIKQKFDYQLIKVNI